MSRFRIGRFRDRASYKSSEVVGLFILSLFGWMLFWGLVVAIDFILTRVFHIGT